MVLAIVLGGAHLAKADSHLSCYASTQPSYIMPMQESCPPGKVMIGMSQEFQQIQCAQIQVLCE